MLIQDGAMLAIAWCRKKYNSASRELSLELPVNCVHGDRDFVIGCEALLSILDNSNSKLVVAATAALEAATATAE